MSDQGRTMAGPDGPLSAAELEQIDAYWRAANYLSVGQIYLLDNPLLREPLAPEHCKPRLLGHWGTTPGPQLHLRPHEPGHPELGPRRDLRHRARARRPGDRRERLPRGHLQRGLPEHHAGRRRHAQALPPVLVPGRHPQPRRARRRRARSTRAASSATRSRTRTAPRSTTRTSSSAASSATARRRPGPLATELALEQVPRPGPRRRRPADPPPQRLQDRQPDGPRPHPGGRAAGPPGGLRLPPVLRRGRRPGPDAPADGGGDGRGRRRDPGDPAGGPRRRRATRAAALADDRPAQPEGLDRAEGGRRPALGGHVALAPGPVRRGPHEPRAPRAPRGVDAELPAGGAVRRGRRAHPGARRAAAEELPADERQPARERRAAAARPRAARLPRLRGRGARARRHDGRGDARARHVPPRRHRPQPRDLPPLRPGRDGLEPAGRGLRGDRPPVRRARSWPPTSTRRPRAASWRCSRSTSARAGWRATCSPAATACSTATRPSSTSSTRCSTSTPSG